MTRPERSADWSWVVAPAIVLALAVALGWLVRGAPSPFDIGLATQAIRNAPAWLAPAGELVGSLPVFAVAMVIAGAAAFVTSAPRRGVAFGLGLAVEVPVELIKLAVDRARPPTTHEIEAFGSTASYPSGHVARVVVLGGLLAASVFWRRQRARWVAIAIAGIVAGLVAVARVAGGVHWPTDVVGGVLVGAAWLMVALQVMDGATAR